MSEVKVHKNSRTPSPNSTLRNNTHYVPFSSSNNEQGLEKNRNETELRNKDLDLKRHEMFLQKHERILNNEIPSGQYLSTREKVTTYNETPVDTKEKFRPITQHILSSNSFEKEFRKREEQRQKNRVPVKEFNNPVPKTDDRRDRSISTERKYVEQKEQSPRLKEAQADLQTQGYVQGRNQMGPSQRDQSRQHYLQNDSYPGNTHTHTYTHEHTQVHHNAHSNHAHDKQGYDNSDSRIERDNRLDNRNENRNDQGRVTQSKVVVSNNRPVEKTIIVNNDFRSSSKDHNLDDYGYLKE